MEQINIEQNQLSPKNIQIDSRAFYLDSSYPCQIINLFQSTYLATLSSVETSLPPDYIEVAKDLTHHLITKITKLPTGKSELVYKHCLRFTKSLQSLIINLPIEKETVHSRILEAYNELHSGTENLLSESLINLVNQAQAAFEMPDTCKKFFVKTIVLETEKQHFIQKYLYDEKLELKNLVEDFNETFENFKKKKNVNFNPEIYLMYKKLEEGKQKLLTQAINEISDYCRSLYENTQYEQKEVFCCKIGSIETVNNFEYREWIRLCAIVTVKEPCSLGKIISISEKSILIPLNFKSRSLVIQHNDLYTDICFVSRSTNLIIIEGSDHESVLMLQAKLSEIPSDEDPWIPSDTRIITAKKYPLIERSRVTSGSAFCIGLADNELINSIIYIKELDQLLYTTPLQVYTKALPNNPRKEEKLDMPNAVATINREKKIIFILNESRVNIFTVDLQLLSTILVQASLFTSITSKSINNEITVSIDSALIFFGVRNRVEYKRKIQQPRAELKIQESGVYLVDTNSIDSIKKQISRIFQRQLNIIEEGKRFRPQSQSLREIEGFRLEIIENNQLIELKAVLQYQLFINEFSPELPRNNMPKVEDFYIEKSIPRPDHIPWVKPNPEGLNVPIPIHIAPQLTPRKISFLENLPNISENLSTFIPQKSDLSLNYSPFSEEESKFSISDSPRSSLSTFIKEPPNIDLSIKKQQCTHQCSLQGNCSINSKNRCGIFVDEGQDSHVGYHRCFSEFHFCDEQCPECGCFCNKELNHKDPHEASEHSKCSDGKTCMEKCADPHLHYKDCDGSENCIINSNLKGAHNSILGKDEIECHIYWQILGWDLIAPI